MTQHSEKLSVSRGLLSRRNLFRGAGAGILASAAVPNLAADIDISTIQPLNSFAHVANGYGGTGPVSGGYWTTSFVFTNLQASAATVRLVFYKPDGTALSLPLVGGTRAAQVVVTVPAFGSAVVELDGTVEATVTGWVGLVVDGVVQAQGIFRVHNPGQNDSEAVVPMISRTQPLCIIPFPTSSATLALPFDNTRNYVTSVAFANTATSARTLNLEFRNLDGTILGTVTRNLAAHNQIAAALVDLSGATGNKQGWMRVLDSVSDFSTLAFRFSPAFAFTTWLPIVS